MGELFAALRRLGSMLFHKQASSIVNESPEERHARLRKVGKNNIELIQKWELGHYEVLNAHLSHYRFVLSDTIIERIGIAEILSSKEWLVDNGLYRQAQNADIICLASARLQQQQQQLNKKK